MSNVSHRHAIVPFVSGTSKAYSGQRLSKVGYKSTAKNPAKFASICASVPMIEEEEIKGNVNALLPHIREMLEGVQDKILRSLYEASEGQKAEVTTDELSIQQCISFLAAESMGDRLSAEAIKEWFEGNLADSVLVVVAEKLGYAQGEGDIELTEAQSETCMKHVEVYSKLLQMLAGKQIRLEEKQMRGMENALALAEDGDKMAQKLRAKITALKNAPKIEDLLEL